VTTTVIMVCGSKDYKGKVDDQLAAMVKHYGDVVLITFCSAGPSYQASGWAIKSGIFFAELPNHRRRYGARAAGKAAAAALALGPTVCVTFGRCEEADIARAAGLTVYEV
jgi:hypothetical protein